MKRKDVLNLLYHGGRRVVFTTKACLGALIITSCIFATLAKGGSTAPAVSAGGDHSLSLKGDGTVWAWGGNYWGMLGDGTNTDRNTPVQVYGLTGVTAISAGQVHSLALKDDGTVWAWGVNYFVGLGDGTYTGRYTPVQISSLSSVIAISAGITHSLALKSDGTVWAWGGNDAGQLGDGTTTHKLKPVQVSGLTGIIAISAGSYHSLALKSDGTVWAWGGNYYGGLGDGTNTDRNTPVQVYGLTGVIAISAGKFHSLALKDDGTVWAWGGNYFGQLGDGTYIGRNSPVQFSDLTGVTAISAGLEYSLALKDDGTVWAWGGNGHGQLGDGTNTDRNTPVQVFSLSIPETTTETFYQVGVGTDFTGTVLSIDGIMNLSVNDLPKTFTWDISSDHTFAYNSPLEKGSGERYVWASTSGLSSFQSGKLIVTNEHAQNYTANFVTQYYLTVTSDYGDPLGGGWYDANSTATFTVTSPVGWVIQQVFVGWGGDSTATTPSGTVTMSGPKAVTANWRTDYTQLYVLIIATAIASLMLLMRRRRGSSVPLPFHRAAYADDH